MNRQYKRENARSRLFLSVMRVMFPWSTPLTVIQVLFQASSRKGFSTSLIPDFLKISLPPK